MKMKLLRHQRPHLVKTPIDLLRLVVRVLYSVPLSGFLLIPALPFLTNKKLDIITS